ncbi:MAG: hypothetical protein KA764_13860, partial [Anaerolineales bacterium]|nr:hypothetical protein [Anaerolineales bacterium]
MYLRARYYSTAAGRFVSKDTWRGNYTKPLSLNAWNYSNSDPLNRVDPSGHNPRCSPDLMITSGGAIPNWQNCARERLGQIIDEAWPKAGMALVKLFADAEFSERYGSVAGTTAKRRLDWLLDATRGDYTVDFAQIGGDNGLKEIMADIAPRYSHFKEIWGSDCGFNAQFQDSHLYP